MLLCKIRTRSEGPEDAVLDIVPRRANSNHNIIGISEIDTLDGANNCNLLLTMNHELKTNNAEPAALLDPAKPTAK